MNRSQLDFCVALREFHARPSCII